VYSEEGRTSKRVARQGRDESKELLEERRRQRSFVFESAVAHGNKKIAYVRNNGGKVEETLSLNYHKERHAEQYFVRIWNRRGIPGDFS